MLTEVRIDLRVFKVGIAVGPFLKVDVRELHVLRPAVPGRHGYGLGYYTCFRKVGDLVQALAACAEHAYDTLGGNVLHSPLDAQLLLQLLQRLALIEERQRVATGIELRKAGERLFQHNLAARSALVEMAPHDIVDKRLLELIARPLIVA